MAVKQINDVSLCIFAKEAPTSLTTLKTMAAQVVATAGVENIREAPKQFNNIQSRGRSAQALCKLLAPVHCETATFEAIYCTSKPYL